MLDVLLVHGLVMHVCTCSCLIVWAAPLPHFVLDRLVRDSTPNRVIKQLVEGKQKTGGPESLILLPKY